MPTERLAADPQGIARAAALLRSGQLVAFGTETVYGLGADATNAEAVAAIFAVKRRPRFNPLICHYATATAAFADVTANALADQLARRFWPGPLTLVLPRRADSRVAALTTAGLASLAVRVPQAPAAQALLAVTARPVAAPSANRSGRMSPTSAAHVLAELDECIAAVLDSGPACVGVESTVLDLTGSQPILLRPGGLEIEEIMPLTGPLSAPQPGEAVRAPGMLVSHYAPLLPLRLDADRVGPEEALLAFGPPIPGAAITFQLSAARDLAEAAARLFTGLRALDEEGTRLGLARIAVMPVPARGLGRAIVDRLVRAAAPRPRVGRY